nr:hypothetical protein [uncultured Flavobacterium sp.]
METTFRIFKPKRRYINPSKGNILFAIMIVSLVITVNIPNNIVFKTITIVSIGLYLLYHYTEYTRIEYVSGETDGTITFHQDSLVINGRKIDITEIKKIYLSACDYYGKHTSDRNTIPLSKGTRNVVNLTLTTGENSVVFFKMQNFSQRMELVPFVANLIKNNLISSEKALASLELHNSAVFKNFKRA